MYNLSFYYLSLLLKASREDKQFPPSQLPFRYVSSRIQKNNTLFLTSPSHPFRYSFFFFLLSEIDVSLSLY